MTDDRLEWSDEDDRLRNVHALKQARQRQIERLETRLGAARQAQQRLDEEVAQIMDGVDLDRELAVLLGSR
jgi:hypothetical protein